jgi:hypothetical protein
VSFYLYENFDTKDLLNHQLTFFYCCDYVVDFLSNPNIPSHLLLMESLEPSFSIEVVFSALSICFTASKTISADGPMQLGALQEFQLKCAITNYNFSFYELNLMEHNHGEE